MSERPNVLLIVADQHRRESTRCYGNEQVHSPNLDRMASEGVRFDNCISTHPVCAPYRACLQTGRYGFDNGVMFNDEQVDLSLPTMAQCFDSAGYQTFYFGKCHWNAGKDDPAYVEPARRLGWRHWQGWNNGHYDYDLSHFDEVSGKLTHAFHGRYAPEVQTDFAIDAISRTDQPWVMQLNYGPPHPLSLDHLFDQPGFIDKARQIDRELGLGLPDYAWESYINWVQWFPHHLATQAVPQQHLDIYPLDQIQPPPTVPDDRMKLVRYWLREYYAQISAVDEQVGRLLAMLRRTGRDRDTVVIYTSDHGDWLGSHHERTIRGKCGPHQCSSRVPLLAWGGPVAEGKVSPAPIETVDLTATLLDLAGLPGLAQSPGRSHAPWITQGHGDQPDDVLMMLRSWRGIFDGRYILSIDLPKDGPARPTRLFDTVNDPDDLDNRIDDPQLRPVREDLTGRLIDRLQEAGDPAAATVAALKPTT